MTTRHPRRLLPIALLTVVACTPQPVHKKVLIIGLDGVRVDILGVAPTPHIDSLIAYGYFNNDAQTEITWSGPSWSSMLTGVWSAKHGVARNDFSNNHFAQYPDILTRAEQVRPALNTLAVLDWPPLGTATDGGPLVSDAVDERIVFDGETDGYARTDSLSVAVAVDRLEHGDPDLAFVYLGNIDVVGHERGSLDPAYRRAIEIGDDQVGALLGAIRRRPTYDREDWLVLISTDHGRLDDGSHGGTSVPERTIFYLASGPSTLRGRPDRPPNIVDVAVTALVHVGIAIESRWGLDGQVAGLDESVEGWTGGR